MSLGFSEATVGALCAGRSGINYKDEAALSSGFQTRLQLSWRTSGRQVGTCKGTPSQRDRQQTGTAKGGAVIGLPARPYTDTADLLAEVD